VPYFVLGLGGLALSVGMAIWLFDVPLHGSIIVLVACSALFMLVALGMGLFISVVTRNQFVAGMVGILTTFLPAFFLFGFLFDLGNMPDGVEAVTYIVAARYFVSILQTLFLAGNVWSLIIPNSIILAIMAMIFLSLSRKKSKKQLE
jgi:ABC-2 type transport system permease protein